MQMKGCLLIDNSNTRTKFVLCVVGKAFAIKTVPTKELSLQRITEELSGWFFDRICVCSVVPDALAALREFAAGRPMIELSVNSAPGVDFSEYPGVATLGADRVANVVAAVQQLPLPLVAVDAGTACTFDVVVQGDGLPRFVGGVIAPGLVAMADSLQSRTAMLPSIRQWKEGAVIGRCTQEAMASAVRIGYPGMIDTILDEIERELDHEINVVLTGGDAEFLHSALHRKCHLQPMLTIQGVALTAGLRL